MAKKINSQTKTDHTKCMVCSYCESACTGQSQTRFGTMYMGQKPATPDSISYYCNRSCLLAHGRQERTIYLRKEIATAVDDVSDLKEVYRRVIKYPGILQGSGMTHTSSSILSHLGYTKHLQLFYKGLLARKSAEELHLLRMKAKKYAGEYLEHAMVVHDEVAVDEFSSIMQGDLKDDDNYYILVFALD